MRGIIATVGLTVMAIGLYRKDSALAAIVVGGIMLGLALVGTVWGRHADHRQRIP